MLKLFTKKSKGFTLVELLVVIAVIGILAGIVLVNMGPVRVRARDARRQSDVKSIATALELYFDAQSPTRYPGTTAFPLAGASTPNPLSAYLQQLPSDPRNSATVYPTQVNYCSPRGQAPCTIVSGLGQDTYCLFVPLEDGASNWPTTYSKVFYASERGSGIDQTAPLIDCTP